MKKKNGHALAAVVPAKLSELDRARLDAALSKVERLYAEHALKSRELAELARGHAGALAAAQTLKVELTERYRLDAAATLDLETGTITRGKPELAPGAALEG